MYSPRLVPAEKRAKLPPWDIGFFGDFFGQKLNIITSKNLRHFMLERSWLYQGIVQV